MVIIYDYLCKTQKLALPIVLKSSSHKSWFFGKLFTWLQNDGISTIFQKWSDPDFALIYNKILKIPYYR